MKLPFTHFSLSFPIGSRLPGANNFSCRISLGYLVTETTKFIGPYSARYCMAPTRKKHIIQLSKKVETCTNSDNAEEK